VQYAILKWTFALLIGLGTGLVAFFNNIGVENIAGFKLLLTNHLMLNHKYICIHAPFYRVIVSFVFFFFFLNNNNNNNNN
jgi:hypothetical protein